MLCRISLACPNKMKTFNLFIFIVKLLTTDEHELLSGDGL